MTSIKTYFNLVSTLVGNGRQPSHANHVQTLTRLVSVRGEHSAGIGQQRGSLTTAQLGKFFAAPWDEVVPHHVQTVLALADQNYVAAYQEQLVVAQAVIRSFDRLTLPILFAVLKDLRWVAMLADRQLLERQETAGKLEDAARNTMRAFNFCLNDRAPLETSRKWGTYYIMTLLFKSYIQLKTLNLARNLLRAISAADLPPLESFPKAHVVSYSYYVGLYYFWNEQYDQAEENLMLAFQHCHRQAKKNKGLILRYLLPTSLLYGRLPTDALLKRHGLTELYTDLVKAVTSGNLRLFDEGMDRNEETWIQQGTFLVMERWRTIVFRELVKRVFLVQDRVTRISVSTIQCAYRFAGVEMEEDEVECTLANLIAQGLIKGYLSHEKRMMVLSKDNPFPAIVPHSVKK